MRISSGGPEFNVSQARYHNLIKGEIEKVAPRQVDNFDEINFKGTKDNHRIMFKYNKDLDKNIVHVVDNKSGETVKKVPSDAQVDNMIRIQRLMGLYVDEET